MKEVFSCRQCGHCCHGESTVSLTRAEIDAISRHIAQEPGEFLERCCVVKGTRIEMKIIDGHCIFYGDNGLCSIHPVKPHPCRTWPLHPSILADRNAFEAIRSDCPGFDPDATYDEVCDYIEKATHGY